MFVRRDRLGKPIIFHVDVNSAFLSWESVYRIRELGETTDLRLIPSAVGGDQESRHGVILAKSTPAKPYQIQTGEPIVSALRKCPNLTIVAPRFEVYRRYSKAFIDILKSYSPIVEQYSIDEAFIDMTEYPNIYANPVSIATKLKDQIYEELGFTVNVGISNNKLLAKTAGDFKKPNLVHTLFPEEIERKMWPLDVRDLLFVGKATEQRLKNLGIRTIGELAKTDLSMLTAHFGKQGIMLHEYSNGIDTSIVSTERADPKGYSNSTTIAHDVTDAAEAKHILLSLCESVGARLREDKALATVIGVSMTDYNFHNSSRQKSMFSAVNSTNLIYKQVCELFDALWDGHTPIRLLGVHTSKITKEDNHQYSLFEFGSFETLNKLDQTLDTIKKKFGDGAIMRASFLNKEE